MAVITSAPSEISIRLDNKVYTITFQNDLYSRDYIFEVRRLKTEMFQEETIVCKFVMPQDEVDNDRSKDFYHRLIARYENEERRSIHYQWAGPTNKQLLENPSLKHAWDEYQIVKRLCGL